MNKLVPKSHQCLFCNSTEIVEMDSIASKDIIAAYNKIFNVSVERLFDKDSATIKLLKCNVCNLKWYGPLVAGDAKFYESLQQHDWYYQEHKPEYDFAKEIIKEGDKVLEVGCGSGAFGQMMPANTTYHGLEFNQVAAEKAKKAGLNVRIDSIENHCAQNPNAYDVVCHFQVLEHVTDPHNFLESCVKTLKPGGRLIVAVPSEDSFMSVTESLWLNMPPHHLTRWSDIALNFAFNSLKLEKITFWHEPLADFHKNLYRSSMLSLGFKYLLRSKTKLQKDRGFSRVTNRLEKTTGLGNWLANIGLKQFPFGKNGHTVCVFGYKQ